MRGRDRCQSGMTTSCPGSGLPRFEQAGFNKARLFRGLYGALLDAVGGMYLISWQRDLGDIHVP